MSVFSKKKVLGVFIIFVLVLMCVFTAGISIHTNKVSAAVNIFGVSDGVQNGNQMEFTITRDFGGITATVYYRTISGTALDETHFTGKSGSITFAEGELSKVVSVDILGAHETYGASASSAYTNIDRDFFFEIYSGDQYEFSDPIGQGLLSALSQYSVDPDFFKTDKVFLNDTEPSAISCYPNYILSIPGLGGYYDMTGSAYMLKVGLTYENALEGEIFTMGLAKSLREPEQYYGSYMVDSLAGYGFSEYAIQLYTEAAGTSIVSAPYINEPMEGFSAATNVFVYKQKYANLLTGGYVFMDNSVSNSNYLFVETLVSGAGGYKASVVTGKVYDAQAPTLLGVSGLNHPQKVGDEIYISLVFDEIIDGSLSALAETVITSDSGDFVYQYGAGSNVLVFKGVLGAAITDTITFGTFDGAIRDFSNNEVALVVPQMSVTLEDEYDVNHYMYTATGFELAHTEHLFGNVGESVNAAEIDFSDLGVNGYTAVTTVDTVDSGTVTVGGALTLALYYKMTDVYLSGSGHDMATGNAPQVPVLTFAAAKERLAPDGTIHIVNTVTVSGTETWSLDGFGAAKVSRYAKNYNLIDVTGTLNLENIVIDGNKTALGMGSKAMIKNNSSAYLILYEGAILQNADSRNSEWGAAIINGGYLGIAGGELSNNIAISGGAIHNLNLSGIEFISGKMIGNTATGNGGAIYSQEGSIGIQDGVFENNTAQSTSGGGGAIYNHSGAVSIRSTTQIKNNTASGSDGKGGGIFSTGTELQKGNISMKGGEMFNNSAKNGGAIYTDKNSYFWMEGGKIYNNNATLYGGGISYGSELHTFGCSFESGEISGNSAPVGGGLYLFDGEFVMIDQAIISGNTAVTNGGGVSIKENAKFVLDGGNINNNTATAKDSTGGGIDNAGQLSILGGNISGNTADFSIGFNGGGIANLGGEFELDGIAEIADIIYLDYDFAITLTSYPTENTFSVFLTDWTIEEAVIEGGVSVDAGLSFGNFSIINPNMVLRASIDSKNIIVKTALSITFDKNSTEAIGSMSKQYVLEGETFALSANSFIRDKYFFLGWATTSGGTVAYGDETQYIMGASDTTLYAKWQKTVPSWQDNGYMAEAFDGGSGSAETPYLIADASQLAYLASLVNAGVPDYSSKHYKLTADIDLSIDNFPDLVALGVQKIIWIAIGNPENSFLGSFDGDGYVISGIDVDLGEDTSLYHGLFGMTYAADIKNLGIRGINIVGEAEDGTIGSIVAMAIDTTLSNVFVEDITSNLTLDAGYFGGIVGNGSGVAIRSFYVNSAGDGIVLNGTPSVGGTFSAAAAGMASIGYVHISGLEETLYLASGQEDLFSDTAFDKLYYTSVSYNASALKTGNELRLYRWVDVPGNYPTLEKIVLRSTVTLSCMALEYSLGQEIVGSFDEAILSIAKDGNIIIGRENYIYENELWTLPEEIFGTAYITSWSEYNYYSAYIFVESGATLTLRNIDITNNALDDTIYMFSVDGVLNILEGTTIAGKAITTSTSLSITDNEMNPISIGGIAMTQEAPVILNGPLYSQLVFDDFLDFSHILEGDRINVMDASIYLANCSLSRPDLYYIQAYQPNLIGITKKLDLYFNILAAKNGSGDEISPVNNLESIKALALEGCTVYVMNTVEISTDTVWDLEGYNIVFTNYSTFSGVIFDVITSSELTLKDMSIDINAGNAVFVHEGASLILDETTIGYFTSEFGVAIVVSPTAYVKLGLSHIIALIELQNDGVSSGKVILSEASEIHYLLSVQNVTENQLAVVETDTGLDLTESFDYFVVESPENRLMLTNDEVNNTINIKIQEYSVTFYDKEGGSAYGSETAQAPQTVLIYELASQPEDPFRPGYNFMGWSYFNGTEYEDYYFDTVVTEDLSIVAYWYNYFATEDAEGTEASPFVITEYSHLIYMSDLFRAISAEYDFYKDKYYVLGGDIIVDESAPFTPIGDISSHYFYGTFNGNGHVIRDILIEETYSALIAANYGTITGLGIEGGSISGQVAAAITLINTGTISYCYNSATISALTGAGIAAVNYDIQVSGAPEEPGFDIGLIDSGEISYCYNIGKIINIVPGEPSMIGGITTVFGSVTGCYNAAAVDGPPIAVDAQLLSGCYFNRDYYEDEAGLYTLSMVGESTDTHQNLLYNALDANAPGIWSQPLNDEHTWYYPQLKVFYDNGNYIYCETVYTIEIDFQNGEPNAIEYAVMCGYAPLPVEPEKSLYLFDGWTLDGGDFDFEIDTINGDLYIVARWAIYQLIFDETGLKIIGITIAEGQENVEVTIPDYVTHIEMYAFMDNPVISSVVFAEGSSLVQINTYAFFNTSITELTLPSSIKSILVSSLSGMTFLESVTVENGALNHKTQDGVLYNADMTTLIFYPLNKPATHFEIPASVTRINDYAFYDSNYQGNAYLQSIVLPDGLNEMGNVGLYGLSNLVRVAINNTAPLFTPDANVFRYFDTAEWLKKINDNLVIELPNYTAYTNYMSDSGWDDFDGYYSYPIVVTFNYQGATERNTESTRTTVDGIVDGETIYNGMAMGTMPMPLYFGKNFLAWNTASDGSGNALMADTLLYADTQAYAIWFDWGGVVLTNGEDGAILVNGEEHSGKSVSDIIAVDEVSLVYFNNFAAAEQINIVDKAVSLVGNVSLDFDGIPLFISGSSAVYMDFESVVTPSSIVYIPSGSDGTYVTYARGDLEHAFLQSPAINIGLYPDYAAVPYPGEGNNILCWNVAGNIGRNQQMMYYEDLPTEYTYSPVVAPKVYITDTTTDYTYNATARSVTYTTDKFLFDGECDITYFATETDMLSRINPIAEHIYVGAYYYVISREGRDDYCDITDLTGSFIITPAEVTVETGAAVVTKQFDGYDDYVGVFEEVSHYIISGIFDDATISIISITFNSIHTDALYVTVEISISDTHNYTVNDSFDCYAEITPLDMDISWDTLAPYVYTGEDQGASVQPSYYDVYEQKIELDVAFSGQDPVFKTAGTYTATALTGDDDYAFAYTTAELTIEQAEVTVSPAVGAYLSKVFDDDSYFYDTIDQDIHYIVEGIVDGSTVSITGAEYESMNVGEALTVDVDYEIIGGENYSYTGAFTLLGEITPRNSIAEWSLSVPYTYNGSDQSGEVSALFYDYYGDAVPLAVTFTGRDSVFKYAGTYLATATNIDSNYNVTNYLSNLEMQKAEVSVLSVGETTLTKVYDGDNVYYGDIVLDEHYTVSGLVDDAEVTIESAYFNSSKVAYANEVTISVAISDTDNYTINDGFVYGAYISPFYVDAEWLREDNYVYNGADQASSVGARYTDIDGMYAPLHIEFSGESAQFSTAGEYTATAINYDTNYYLTNVTADLVIDKADAIILGSIQQEHTYDGIQKDVAVGLNHTETTLTFAPEQGYTDAGNYEITVSAAETHNYLPETLVVILIIYKADYEGISHDELYGVYTPGLTLADITLNDDFYWTQPETPIFAGETQNFGAYYNADFDNYESYELLITVSIEKAAPVITNMPVASSFIAGRELSNSALSGGTADIPGTFSWRDGLEIISTAGLNTREAAFIPEDTDNYYSAIFDVDVVTHFLRITFASYEHESVFEVTYNAEIAVLDFPQPAPKTGYDVAWEIQEDIMNIVEDATVNAVYTLLNPEVEITGYTQPVTYGTVVTLMAEPWHALSSAAMSYEWYYGEAPGIITTSNFVILSQVAESGSYKVIITADDGEQQKTVEAMVEVVINKAAAIITAEPVQEHTYNGEPKEIVAELNHSETELIYAPAQGYTEANEEGYLITVSAAETDNYLATQEDITLIIRKATVDMSGISFQDGSFVYDGESHSIQIIGELPSLIGGLSVNYLYNSLDIVGEVEVIAEFSYNQNNYNQIPDMLATITVTPRPINVIIHDKDSVYGEAQVTLTCTVTGQVAGDELNLTLEKQGAMNFGTYVITGSVGNTNYDATFTNGEYTVHKATHDMSGISFNNKTVIYNAAAQSVVITGSLPAGVQAAYESNTATVCGSYDATVSFVYDTENFEAIESMSATLVINPKPLTVTFSDYTALFFDGTVKTVKATLNGIPAAETAEVLAVISYDKQVIAADYYTATVTITDSNYVLTGETELDFIVYLSEVKHTKELDDDVIARLASGFLPGTTIQVTNISERVVIASGEYEGKESKQHFEISILGNPLANGQTITMRLLISDEYRYLENLRVGKLADDGSLTEIASVREGDYLVFQVQDNEATYVIIGDGKNSVLWVYGAIGGGLILIALASALLARAIKKRKLLKLKILGI